MQVKGVEFGMHEPRIAFGRGLSYAINPHGADHMTSLHDTSLTQEGPGIKKARSLGVMDPMRTDDLGPAKVEAVMVHHFFKLFYGV